MRLRPLAIGVLIVVVVIAGLAFGGYRYYDSAIHQHQRVGQQAANITVPQGTSVSGVADILTKHGIIGNALVFQLYVRLNGYSSRLEAGHYQLPGGMNIVDVVALLGHARGNEVSVTVPEGLTNQQIAELMQQKGLFSSTQYLAAVHQGTFNNDFLADKPASADLEGFLFPDTFSFSPKATPGDAVTAQLNRFGEVVTPDLRAHAADHQLSLYQSIILASIIEREARFNDDRGQIAAVFYNRLSAGMPLEADATLLFAKGVTSGDVAAADKLISSPYNTYLNKGLPPGPICNPGLASIVAALTPAQNDFLFYLTDKDGHAHFSRTLAQHQQQQVQFGVH